MLRRFLRDESGATAIEYGLICAGIALAIITAVGLTGDRLVALFTSLLTAFGRTPPLSPSGRRTRNGIQRRRR